MTGKEEFKLPPALKTIVRQVVRELRCSRMASFRRKPVSCAQLAVESCIDEVFETRDGLRERGERVARERLDEKGGQIRNVAWSVNLSCFFVE